MVLKLFDRRFATELSKDQKITPWTPDIEKKYHQFVLDGGASKLIAETDDNSEKARQESDIWNYSQNEAYFHDYNETEVEVYDTLEDTYARGSYTPTVHMPYNSQFYPQTTSVSQYVDIPGIDL
jgi:hypothetical protein